LKKILKKIFRKKFLIMQKKNENIKFCLKNKITENFCKYTEFEFPRAFFEKILGNVVSKSKQKYLCHFLSKNH
jgi:hypothetical protein